VGMDAHGSARCGPGSRGPLALQYRGVMAHADGQGPDRQSTDRAKDAVRREVEAAADALVGLSHRIWEHPELGFEEELASAACSDLLDGAGFDVTSGVAGLPTAFVAEYGSGSLTVGICAEYDALPKMGHACGHNMIAASAIGAGLALARVADDLDLTVRVLGTPAEEGGAGKVIMVEQGAFDGINAAMMIHPAPTESDVFPTLAATGCDYHFHGRSAHASLAPNIGVNAADAITVAQVAIGLLRQHLEPTDQVHGIVTDGGEAPNIVPEDAIAHYMVRAPDLAAMHRLQARINRCFEAGALATGASLEMTERAAPYSEFRHDDELALAYRANAEALGRVFAPRPTAGAASTDMANISLLMPTIHPSIGLDCAPAVNHQPEFAAFCATGEADRALLEGAMAMAMTCLDAGAAGSLRDRLLANDTVYGGRSSYPWTSPT
jgi:amidohydrolase